MKDGKTRYYESFEDEFETTADQNYKLPDDYKWIRTDLKSKILSPIIYGAALVFGTIYCRLILKIRFKGRKNLKGQKGNFFVYANHAQPVGDVFTPALCVFPKRIYTVVSTANYGIPFIGKILPYLGALPIENSLRGIKELSAAIERRTSEMRPVVIYPEARVWKYYTGIRPFPETSFKFPSKSDSPIFVMTSVYKKSHFFKRPITETYIDGPFYPSGDNVKEKAAFLCEKTREVMESRSALSDCEYIKYRKKGEK